MNIFVTNNCPKISAEALLYNRQDAFEKISPYLLKYRTDIKRGAMKTFANCARSEVLQIDFKHTQDTYEAYKQYLIARWRHDKLPPKWINRKPPIWYSQ